MEARLRKLRYQFCEIKESISEAGNGLKNFASHPKEGGG